MRSKEAISELYIYINIKVKGECEMFKYGRVNLSKRVTIGNRVSLI